jgi:uncharacterized protein (DUF697 family)
LKLACAVHLRSAYPEAASGQKKARAGSARRYQMSSFSNPLTEYSPQMEAFEFSSDGEFGGNSGAGVFNENEEMELAAELLEVNDEQELDQFLGDLIKKAGRAIGGIVRSPIGQAIGGALKGIASKALPIAGGALGGIVGGPLGASLGSGLANMAGKALGLELEGLSSEDREFEATKQFVRFAGEAVKNAMQAPPGTDPAAAAKAAIAAAASQHAPGLVNGGSAGGPERHHKRRSGRWIRKHGKIIVLGI